MTSSIPNNAARAYLERSFFLANCTVLSVVGSAFVGALGEVSLFKELSLKCDLICVSREGCLMNLVFPDELCAQAAEDLCTKHNVSTGKSHSPMFWPAEYSLKSARPAEDRHFFRSFLDIQSQPQTFEADEYIHAFWNHNLAWYILTLQLREPSLGFFVIPRILIQCRQFDFTNYSSPVPVEEGVTQATEQDPDADQTLVEPQLAQLAQLDLIDRTASRSPKRKAIDDHPTPTALPPIPSSPKRPRSTPPAAELPRSSEILPTSRSLTSSPVPSITISLHDTTSSTRNLSPIPRKSVPFAVPGTKLSDSATTHEPAQPYNLTATPSTGSSPVPTDPAMRVLLDHSTWVPNIETPWFPIHSILRIPRNAGGHVVGKEGCGIKGIMKETNVNLMVRNAIVDGYALVYFGSGTSEEQAQALKYIKKKVGNVDRGWKPETNYVSLS